MEVVALRGLLAELLRRAGPGPQEPLSPAWRDLEAFCRERAVTGEERQAAAAVLLQEESGLPFFLRTSLSEQGSREGAGKVRAEVYQWLASFLEAGGPPGTAAYAGTMAETTLYAFKREEGAAPQAASLAPLASLLQWEQCPLPTRMLEECWAELMRSLLRKRLADSVKGEVLQTLGLVLQTLHERGGARDAEEQRSLLDICCGILGTGGTKAVSKGLTAGALVALGSILALLPEGGLDVERAVSVAWVHVTQTLEEAAAATKDEGKTVRGRYDILKAVLRLLREQAGRLSPGFMGEAQPPPTQAAPSSAAPAQAAEGGAAKAPVLALLRQVGVLRCEHQNKDVRGAAEGALSALYRQLSEELLQRAAPGHLGGYFRELLQRVLGRVAKTLDSPKAGSREVAAAISGCRYLIQPAAALLGPQSVEALGERLAALVPSQQLEIVVEALRADVVGREAGLLGALSQILRVAPDPQEQTLSRCVQVASRLSAAYGALLYPKQREPVPRALRDLLDAAAEAPDQPLLPLLHRLVPSLLSTSISPPILNSLGQEQQILEEPWKLYLGLWNSLLLDPGDTRPASRGPRSLGPAGTGAVPTRKEAPGMSLQSEGSAMVLLESPTATAWQRPLVDALMQACLDGMASLDLRYSSVPPAGPAENEEAEGAPWLPDLATSRLAEGLRAQNPADMQAFIALSSLMSSLIPLCGARLFAPWMEEVVRVTSNGIATRPLLSGYYRLLRACLMQLPAAEPSAASGLHPDPEPGTLKEIREVLREVSVASRRYSGELLAASLDLLLASPASLLSAQEVAAPLIEALRLGIVHLPLAESAVAALEHWETAAPSALPTVAPLVVPWLEPYLRPVPQVDELTPSDTTEEAPATPQGEQVNEGTESPEGLALEESTREEYRRIQREAAAAARKQVEARTQGLAALQPRILAWLGRAGGLAAALVERPLLREGAGGTGASARWDPEDRLGLEVSAAGHQDTLLLHVDSLLPRVAYVAEHSPNRSARVAACEFLHAVTLLIIGKNASKPAAARDEQYEVRPTELHVLLSRLLPVLLRVAAGGEPVARQLLGDLLFAHIRWLTRSARREAAEVVAMMEALLEGLTEGAGPPAGGATGDTAGGTPGGTAGGGLCTLCAAGIREMLQWSARHLTDPAATNLNAQSLLRRLLERLAHPSPQQRLGAATALGMCAETLARETSLQGHVPHVLKGCVEALRASARDPPGSGAAAATIDAIKSMWREISRRPALIETLKMEKNWKPGQISLRGLLEWLWGLGAAPERSARVYALLLLQGLNQLACDVASPRHPGASSEGAEADRDAPAARWLYPDFTTWASESKMATPFLQVPLQHMSGKHAISRRSDIVHHLQAMEGAVHWATWALQWGFIKSDDLEVRSSGAGKTSSSSQPLLSALRDFFRVIPEVSGPPSPSGACGILAGCDADVFHLSARLFDLLRLVVGCNNLFPAKDGGLHRFILTALLRPRVLGSGSGDAVLDVPLPLKAKALLEAAVENAPDLLYGLRPALHKLLDRMPIPLFSRNSGEGEGTSPRGSSDTSGTFSTGGGKKYEMGRGEASDRGRDTPRVAAGSDKISRWETLEGLVVLHELKAPPDLHLLPNTLLQTIPSRIVSALGVLEPNATTERLQSGKRALSLAVRLGVPAADLLSILLEPRRGINFYETFRSTIHPWLLWNAGEVAGPLCGMAGGDQGSKAQAAALRVLTGTLDALLAAQKSSPFGDVRSRSFIAALLPHMDRLQGLLDGPKRRAVVEGEAGTQGQAAEMAAEHVDGLLTFLQISGKILELDGKAALAPASPALPILQNAYVSMLRTRGSATAAVRAEALGQLRWWLTADPPVAAAVVDALASLVDANFPLASRELPRGSTQAAEYQLQLLAAFDGIVSAAEAGADVGPALQALLLVLREMGEGKGHVCQAALIARLALIASSPWRAEHNPAGVPLPEQATHGHATPTVISGGGLSKKEAISPATPPAATGSHRIQKPHFGTPLSPNRAELAETRGRKLFGYVWDLVFETGAGVGERPPELRKAVLHYLLLKLLRAAPPSFQVALLREKVPALLALSAAATSTLTHALRGGDATGLVQKDAAFLVWDQVYRHVPPGDIKSDLFRDGGSNPEVMQRALDAIRDTPGSEEGDAGLWRSMQCAAFAAATSLVVATQHKAAFFEAPLKPAKGEPDAAGPWKNLLDWRNELRFSEEVGGRTAWNRVADEVQQVTQRLRAERRARAGIASSSFGFGATIGSLSFASVDSSLLGSQAPLGESQALASEGSQQLNIASGVFNASLDFIPEGDAQPVDSNQMVDGGEWVPEEEEVLPTNDDELDRSPAMWPLIRLVEKATELETPSATGQMPGWLRRLHTTVQSPDTPTYVRHFLVRMILHVDKRAVAAAALDGQTEKVSVFASYANQWLPAIVGAMVGDITTPSARQHLHYFLLDVSVMLLSWQKQAPLDISSIPAATDLLSFLVRAGYSESSPIAKNNFALIKMFMWTWRGKVPLRARDLLYHLSTDATPKGLGGGPGGPRAPAPAGKGVRHDPAAISAALRQRAFGMKLLAAGLMYGYAKQLLSIPKESENMVARTLGCINAEPGSVTISAQAGETIGVILQQLSKLESEGGGPPGDPQLAVQAVREKAQQKMVGLAEKGTAAYARFAAALERLTRHYPAALDPLRDRVVAMLPRLATSGSTAALLLAALRMRASLLPGLLGQVLPVLDTVMASNNAAVLTAALELLSPLLADVAVPDTKAGEVLASVTQRFAEVRPSMHTKSSKEVLFKMLRDAWQTRPSLQARLRPPLLWYLGDPDAGLRRDALQFWDSVLPHRFDDRLRQLLRDGLEGAGLWGTAVERNWAGGTAALLLEGARSGSNLKKPLFSNSLGECTYTPYQIDTAAAATFDMAPLFSSRRETLDISKSLETNVGGLASQAQRSTQVPVGMVRATAAGTLLNSITLNIGYPSEAAVPRYPHGHSTTDTLGPNVTIQRRLTSYEDRSRILAARARRVMQGAAAGSISPQKVTLLRQYRRGELPDILQVTLDSLLKPLGLLQEHDGDLSLLLVEAFAKAAVGAAPEGGAAHMGSHGLRDALQLAFERGPTAESYVQALQRIALQDRGCWVDPDLLSKAALAGSVPGGLLQLEQQLCFAGDSATASGRAAEERGPHKRQRLQAGGSGGTKQYIVMPHPPSKEEDWAVLAALYSSLGLSHLANLSYSAHVVRCPGTKSALADIGSRNVYNAYRKLEAMMRAVDNEGAAAVPMETDDTADTSAGEGTEEDELPPAGAVLGAQEPSKAEERLWFVERSQCLEEMGDWQPVLEVLDGELQYVADTWQPPRQPADPDIWFQALPACDWDGPKLLRQYVRACLFQPNERSRLVQLLEACSADLQRMSVLHSHVPAEVALLYASSADWTMSSTEVTEGWSNFQRKWAGLHPLNRVGRHEALSVLQPLSEVLEVVQVVKTEAFRNAEALEGMAAKWRYRWPSRHVPAASATLSVAYGRQALLDGVAGTAHRNRPAVQEALSDVRSTVSLAAAQALEGQGFIDASAKLLEAHAGLSLHKSLAAAEACLRVALARMAMYESTIERPPKLEDEVRSHLAAVQALSVQHKAPRGAPLLLSAVASSGHGTAVQISAEDRTSLLLQGEATEALAKADAVQLEAAWKLYREAARQLDRTSDGAAVGAAAALQIAKLCDNCLAGRISLKKASGDVAAGLVDALLMSLYLGSTGKSEAELYIPRAILLLTHVSACRAWETAWRKAPLHVYLPWVPQMLSLMGTTDGDPLIPCLEELARQYRQRMYFLYHTSCRSWGPEAREKTSLLASLLSDPLMAAFGRALNDLVLPAQRWMAWSSALIALISANKHSKAVQLYREEVRPDMIGRHLPASKVRGRANEATTVNGAMAQLVAGDCDKAFGPEGEKLSNMSRANFEKEAGSILGTLRRKLGGLRGKRDVASLSPWLSSYPHTSGAEELVLLPSMGWAGGGPPLDVHVVGFGSTVHVFESKQQPMKLSMYGEDFRTYEWVVKGGEDVRVDQRVEQLFGACNGRLDLNPGSSSHQLRVPTYDVVAVGPSLGLVQFVASTVPLKALITKPSLISEQEMEAAGDAYLKALLQNGGATGQGPEAVTKPRTYNTCYGSAKRADVVARFRSAEACVRWDALREALLRMAGGPEEFLAMRQTFWASLAASCVTGYIAGCGDRHLDNFLLHSSGSLIPIDFGYSFGTGTQVLPIPELVPFRLTRQLVGAFQPHLATSALLAPLAQGLLALRASRHIIEGITAIFLREPIVDWQREARILQSMSERGKAPLPEDVASVEEAHINLKLEIVQMKLAGRHPADVMVAELSGKHAGQKHWQGLVAVVRGDESHNVRARIPGGDHAVLSPEQQAECLLDQATDPNVLGRMYFGWRPWL